MIPWGWTDEFRKKWKPHEDNLRHREDQPSCSYCSTLLQSPIVLLYQSGDPLWWAGLPGPSVSLSLPSEHLMLMPAHPFQGPPGFTVSETPSLTYPSSQEEWDPCLSVSIMLWYSIIAGLFVSFFYQVVVSLRAGTVLCFALSLCSLAP